MSGRKVSAARIARWVAILAAPLPAQITFAQHRVTKREERRHARARANLRRYGLDDAGREAARR